MELRNLGRSGLRMPAQSKTNRDTTAHRPIPDRAKLGNYGETGRFHGQLGPQFDGAGVQLAALAHTSRQRTGRRGPQAIGDIVSCDDS